MAGTTYQYAGGNKASLVYAGDTIRLDDVNIVEDIPGEAISPIGDSYGDAASAGIVMISGSFNGRLLNAKTGSSNQHAIMMSSNQTAKTAATLNISTDLSYSGDIIITGANYTAAGGAVAKISGSFLGCQDFKKAALAT